MPTEAANTWTEIDTSTPETDRQKLAAELTEGMAYANGAESWYQHTPRRLIYTSGVRFVAEKAGAYWLIDAIASHYSGRMMADLNETGIHFWTLTVDRSGKPKGTTRSPMARLECRRDSGLPAIVSQPIPFTDFPLDEFKLYVQSRGHGNAGCLMLPSEY